MCADITLLKALADETRLNITRQLMDGERCACAIVPATGRAQSTVSGHLRVLEEAGIVSSRRVGTNIWYALTNKKATRILRTLGEQQ